MTVKVGRTFVYGNFDSDTGTGRDLAKRINLLGSTYGPEFAVEIVREHSANEFVGKLYRTNASGNWTPVDPGILSKPDWQEPLPKRRDLKFNMGGSGPWKVLYFRTESDHTSPYIAVALRYAEEAATEERNPG